MMGLQYYYYYYCYLLFSFFYFEIGDDSSYTWTDEMWA